MKTKARDRFDLRSLRGYVGDTTFARGEAYHRGGHVTILSLGADRVLAEVSGTDDYRVVLTGKGTAFGGECSCPAFEDRGFCKHMIATALAANAAAENGAGADDTLVRIRQHLRGRGLDALVAMIVELAERDLALLRKLDVAATASSGDAKTVEARLRKAIDVATRTRGFVDYREAHGWASGVEEALDTVADLASGPRADVAIRLAGHALARIEAAMHEIDNSDGHGGALLEQARDIHLAACRGAPPDPVALARDLFTRETEGGYDTFLGAAAHYADVLGDAGLAEYRRLATEAWEALPRPTPRGRALDEHFGKRFTLMRILDFFAERDGDLDAQIALRAGDLFSQYGYLQLAEFCRAHGRTEAALRHAEEGLWMFEDDRPDERLVFFTADLLADAGRKADAEAHLWRAFEAAPSLTLCGRLRKLGGEAALERAIRHLEAPLAADLLVQVLMEERRFDRAWAVVRTRQISRELAERLARASEASHPQEALAVYAEEVEALARSGGNPAYGEAARLVARMAALRDAGAQAAYLADLKTRHARKRNFVRLLA